MKNIKLLITIIIIGASINSAAQNRPITGSTMNFAGDDASFESSAKILVAMTLTKNNDLRFGTIMVSSDAEGTVIINPETDGIAYTEVAAGTDDYYDTAAHAAKFTVTGSPENTYGVMMPNNYIDVTNTQVDLTSETMRISALTISFDGGASTLVVDGSASISTIAGGSSTHIGTSTFQIGGTLTVTAKQAGGTYENNDTTIFVDYN
ncbi:MAG: hypothetical protein ACI9YE_002301 [Psychroserpens sp.]|jgi:hypothetical protein